MSIVLNHELLDSTTEFVSAPESFAACLNAHGLYNTLQFVLRLSPRVHKLMDAIEPGVHRPGEVDPETIQAYSTYLHETIHWWQHMGSSTGLVFSLCYPAQSHINLLSLQEVIKQIGLQKSLMQWAENSQRSGMPADNPALQAANSAVNNAIDVEFYKLFISQPELAERIFTEQYFECVGHSYHITYRMVVDLVASTFDTDHRCIPNVDLWGPQFERLAAEKVEGFYHGSPIRRGPVGIRAIFEGQARFIQLQFLTARNSDITCDELGNAGYFDGVYGEAFFKFLGILGLGMPRLISDPIVSLFLLICDIAINPTAGFPCQIESFEDFILDTDPGIRFARLCLAAKEMPDLHKAITNLTREEYVTASEALVSASGLEHPFRGLEQVAKWVEGIPAIQKIMEEKETFNYERENVPVRVMLSHFIAFSADKLQHPEFFCWAGARLAGSGDIEQGQRLFLRHLSIYADRGDKEGVYPRDIPGKDREGVMRTLNNFYGLNMIYDLTRQWILQQGPFVYDYSWLTDTPSQGYADWAKRAFEHLYGEHPDKAIII